MKHGSMAEEMEGKICQCVESLEEMRRKGGKEEDGSGDVSCRGLG